MIARTLRFEALESRRLFAIDLDLNTAVISSANQSLESQTYEQSTLSTSSDTQLSTLTSGDMEVPPAEPLVMRPSDMQGNPFIVETETHIVAARLIYAQRSTELHFLARKEDGTAVEVGTLNLDMQVERLLRLGSKVLIFGSVYQSDLTPDLRFGSAVHNKLLVIEPDTQKITYQTPLSGSVLQTLELPHGVAFKTVSIHTPASDSTSEPIGNSSNNGVEIPTSVIVDHSSNTGFTYELAYLYPTDNGLEFTRETIDHSSIVAYSDGSLVALSPHLPSDAADFCYTIRRWTTSEAGWQEIEPIALPKNISEWEYLKSFELSPAESKLLISRPHQELIDDQTWTHKLSLDWLERNGHALTVTGSYTLEAFIGTARWINEDQILLLSYEAPAEIKILDISDAKKPVLSTIPLTQHLQLNHHLRIGENHIALFGFTPVTPLPIDASGESGPDLVPMVATNSSNGAIVLVDLRQKIVTDERVFGPNTMLDQPLPISSRPHHFAYRSFTTLPDWSHSESVHVSTIDAQGKLIDADELVLGSEWNFHLSNGSVLTIISANYIEERGWSDLRTPLWKVGFTAQAELPYPLPVPIDPLVPEGNGSNKIGEEPHTQETAASHLPMDTNGDGIVSPIDVLQVINHINQAYTDGNRDELLIISSSNLTRFDFDGDGMVLPTDAMMMIASLNLTQATFESLDHVSIDPEFPNEFCFWDLLKEEHELPGEELVNASIEELLGSIYESTESLFAENFWNWFAPMDPWADRVKQQRILIVPNLET